LVNKDKRITVHLGRLEPRTVSNPAAKELRQYLGGLKQKIDPQVFSDLSDIARRHTDATVPVEKAVDVMLAVDLVTMAIGAEYDAAYCSRPTATSLQPWKLRGRWARRSMRLRQ
jgi:hypothetical protein